MNKINQTPVSAPVWLREACVASPAVSIIMAAWNVERFVGDAMESILNQPDITFELIVVDDASDDSTLQKILTFDDARLTVGKLSTRLEAGAVRNRAIAKARAPWLCVFDADDIMEPGALANYVKTVTACPARSWAYCGLRLVDIDNHALNIYMCTPFEWLRILERNIVAHPMSLFTQELFSRAGGYNESLPRQEDYDLWLRCLFFATPFFYNHICVRYRRHPTAIGERQPAAAPVVPRAYLRELLSDEVKYARAPGAEAICAVLAFIEAWEEKRWDATLKLGKKLDALGVAGFEIDRCMAEAFVGLSQPQPALALSLRWLQKMAEGASLLPHEQLWTIVLCLNLMRVMKMRAELTALLPLAEQVYAMQPDKTLAGAINAARIQATSA